MWQKIQKYWLGHLRLKTTDMDRTAYIKFGLKLRKILMGAKEYCYAVTKTVSRDWRRPTYWQMFG